MAESEATAAIARCIIGPRLPVPAGSSYTLEALRECCWGMASDSERHDALNAAEAILRLPIFKSLER
ncbi:hypothetical protein BRAO375_3660016 [Bradyrhizobium sp. ORS 375]|nr:hypothetical protein BRAO375_3660016 [Bradyrhizobium sp. ORS 375]